MIEPVITNHSLFGQVKSKIGEIKETIIDLDPENLELGLMAGKAGMVLFLANHARIFRSRESADHAVSMLESVVADINESNIAYTYSDGLAGAGWLLLHLDKHRHLDYELENDWNEMDRVMAEAMELAFSQGNYDLLHGGMGYGMYFLERYAQDQNPAFLNKAVSLLSEMSKQDAKGNLWWETDIHLDKVIHGINLGMAHGMPGIISFLSRLYLAGIQHESCLPMINGACSYLLQCRLDNTLHRSCYPGWTDGGTPSGSRMAWCYGDPGVGLAFRHAGEVEKTGTWMKESQRIFRFNAGRKSLEKNYLFDAGLCHGTAGLAQIYNRLYHRTHEELFRETSAFWIGKTLEMARHKDGLAGFKACRSLEDDNWETEAGLLEGIAGIGLALMASLSNEESYWDESLMIV